MTIPLRQKWLLLYKAMTNITLFCLASLCLLTCLAHFDTPGVVGGVVFLHRN
jgi:hypothetical protein